MARFESTSPLVPVPHAEDHRRRARAGVIYALAAYLSWGLVPAYFKLLADVPPLQVLAHRIIWSVVLLVPLIAQRRMWGAVGAALRNRRTLGMLTVSTLLVATNWFTFIYAVAIGRIVETSLGYYINPLLAVLLGLVILRERLRLMQWVSIGLAVSAVALLTIARGQLPVISLILAGSFALYGFMRKITPVGAIAGLFVETLILFVPAVGAVVWGLVTSDVAFVSMAPARALARLPLLMSAGVVTALPLIWFVNGTQRLRLSTMGLLQYLSPTCSLMLAVLVYREAVHPAQFVAFGMIWVALVIFSVDSFRAFRRGATVATANGASAPPAPGEGSAPRQTPPADPIRGATTPPSA